MGYLSEKIDPEVSDQDAARAVCENRLWALRISLIVAAVSILVGYGIFYPGRSWMMLGLAAVATAIVLPLAWLFVRMTVKPDRLVGAIREQRQRGQPVQILTRRGLSIMGLVFQTLALIGIYYLATTPI